MPAANAPPAPTHRVLLRRTYRFAAWWTKGPGRHAGKILAILPIATLVLLVVWIFIINSGCSVVADFDSCVRAFHVINTAAGVALLLVAFLCVAVLIARLELLVWRARHRRKADQALGTLRARLGGADPLADARYASLFDRWKQADGPELLQRRVALLLLTPALVLPMILFVMFAAAQEHFQDFGSLFVFEFTTAAQNYAMLELGLVVGTWVEVRLAKAILGCRRILREKREELEMSLEASASELVRKHQNPHASATDAPAFTFRSFTQRADARQQNG